MNLYWWMFVSPALAAPLAVVVFLLRARLSRRLQVTAAWPSFANCALGSAGVVTALTLGYLLQSGDVNGSAMAFVMGPAAASVGMIVGTLLWLAFC